MQILCAASHFQEDIKKSKFIAQAVLVSSPDEAMEQITALSDAGASHNCWAYRVGDIFRFNDDGEPSGTGGRPILAAIDNNAFDQTLVVVTRIYGGIQLGTGGLARAYGSAAKQCLLNAKTETLVPSIKLSGFCPYTLLDTFKARITDYQANIFSENFENTGALLIIKVPEEFSAAIIDFYSTFTRGEYALKKV